MDNANEPELVELIETQLSTVRHGLILVGDPALLDRLFMQLPPRLLKSLKPSEQHERVLIIEPTERPSIGIERVRGILTFCNRRIPAKELRYQKMVMVAKGHLLTTEAQNALLKIIEEPPEGVLFLFGTPKAESLLPTVRSRLQVLNLALGSPASDSRSGVQFERLKELLSRPLAERLAAINDLTDQREHAAQMLRQFSEVTQHRIAQAAKQGVTPSLRNELVRAELIEAAQRAIESNGNIKIHLLKTLLAYI